MPPAVPVVITSLGWTSWMIWRHTSMFGSSGPSWDIWDSDLKITTDFLPIVVVQKAPRRLASVAGQPARIFLEMVS